MIKRTDSNSPGDTLHQVKIELVTDKHWQKIQAVCYPNYDNTIRIKMNTPGLGFDMDRDHARDLIEVLQAALRACE
ncbi:hypothetical protein AU156_gp201 [Edwardsiella phage PEi20]|uniref:Uncharacterized protein n=1 Tax=Edwardsiella phage PEi20 TaxID=1608310 RepID=A0A0B6VSV3_9CAUD|nr:hypothetical protein AU156_gp201 [Edwardsiella phage PEi20]BAQ22900.1 conserved hypothetical protein [Edwardsiella phage PEi20]